jgi:hypothetical protein
MTPLNASLRDILQPPGIAALPVDERGFPVPWFVDWPDGKPDHRVVDTRKLVRAVNEKRCWICGVRLRRIKASVVGPMCAVNRISSEPPSHPECARYSVLACPFLSKPRARRNEKDLPEERKEPAGVGLRRNPGATLIWESIHPSKPFRVPQGEMLGTPGILFDLGAPYRVSWWREGRPATRYDAQQAFDAGLPALTEVAEAQGQAAIEALAAATAEALLLFPAAA